MGVVYGQSQKEYAKKYPERKRAVQAVNLAVKQGLMPAAKEKLCWRCLLKHKRKRNAYDYHHYLGYEEWNQYYVIPLCRSCHKQVHQEQK